MKIKPKFVPNSPITNTPALAQMKACAELAKAFIWTNDGLVYWRIYMSLNVQEMQELGANGPFCMKWLIHTASFRWNLWEMAH